MTDARGAYLAGAAAHEAAAAVLERRLRLLGAARVGLFLLLVVAAWRAAVLALPPWVVAGVAVAFAVLVGLYARLRNRQAACVEAAAFHRRGLARLDHAWVGRGRTGLAWRAEGHPAAADLDLFGPGSLFEYLCEAGTLAGERTLAGWLQQPAPPGEVAARQAAVRELAPRLGLRESLAVLGADPRHRLDERPLVAWAAQPPSDFPAATLLVSQALVAALLATVWLAYRGTWPGWAVLVSLGAMAGWAALLRGRVRATITGVGAAGRELAVLAGVLERLEQEPAEAPRLQALRGRLAASGRPASRQVWRLRRLIALLDSRGNQLVMLVLPLLLWTTQVAVRVAQWRREVGPAIGDWLAAVGEYEALASLAGYAFEHPADAWPDVRMDAGFEATGLGHPLLREGGVRNDVALTGERRLLVVSGSNMSGKSTLLRSVGTAVVMAQAGAPVAAESLALEPLAVGASIATHDSLLEGSSRFYAEITRLRQLLELTRGDRTVLFLLDELLSGTNSHDRRIGAEAVVRSLLDRGAIGLLTTHDLALAQVAEALAPRAANVHFEDALEEGRITFDYRMRPGVVARSNALALMRSIGLEV